MLWLPQGSAQNEERQLWAFPNYHGRGFSACGRPRLRKFSRMGGEQPPPVECAQAASFSYGTDIEKKVKVRPECREEHLLA